jgi:cytochrome c553
MKRLLKIILLGVVAASVRRIWTRESTDRPSPTQQEPEDASLSWSERLPLNRWLTYGAALLGIAAVGGFLVAASGIIPIKASSGHWAITRWFLSFSMHRSVATHTIGMEVPPLDTPQLVLKGAGHYETGCRPCHGSPSLHSPRIPGEMTPEPPYLPPEIPKWEPEELFYIVKHGIKFTGMPAWPARHRDDEVWAVVAFLRALPDLEVQEYQRLAQGEAATASETAPIQDLGTPQEVPPAVTQSCIRCHGREGYGRGTGAFPRLAGQQPTYLHTTLEAFARGERHSGIMEPIAAGLSEEDMRAIARYYGRQAGMSTRPAHPSTTAHPNASQSIARGRTIANEGIPRRRVPSCVDCHGPSPTRRNPAYPLLAGQYADYLVLQLELFKEDHRGGSAYARLMDPAVHRLTPQQMRDVALYYESLVE